MPIKTIAVELNQDATFRTECRAGKHTLIIDQPANAGGSDAGPTPLDFQLFALGGCITAIGRIIAHQRRLSIRGFRVNVTGEINTDGLLGKPATEGIGFSAIQATVNIDADLTTDEKRRLLHEIDERCPISCNLKSNTAVTVQLAD